MRISAIKRRTKRLKRIPRVKPERVIAGFVVLYIAAVLVIAHIAANTVPGEKLREHLDFSRNAVNLGYFAVSGACFGYAVLLRLKCGRLSGDIVWPVAGTLLLIRGFALRRSIRIFGIHAVDDGAYLLIHAASLAVLALFIVTETLIAVNCFRPCPKGMDALIVHGARSGSHVLFARADAASAYMQRNTATFAVASGGCGTDETVTEARSIEARIADAGIDAGRVLLEEESRTTRENLENSVKLLPEECVKIAVVTDDYHVFRARCMARAVLKRSVYGLPVHASYVSLPHYILREFFSCAKHIIRGDLFE